HLHGQGAEGGDGRDPGRHRAGAGRSSGGGRPACDRRQRDVAGLRGEGAEPAVGLAAPAHPHQGVADTAGGLRQVLPLVRSVGRATLDPERGRLMLSDRMVRGTPPPIGRLLGFVLKAVEPGRAVFEMEADERHHNPMGTLHGGVYCDLADAAMGYAYAAMLGEGETFTTVELKINFLRAVRQGRLIAEARVVKAGSTLGYVECDVKDQTGRLVARAASTCMKLREARPTTR